MITHTLDLSKLTTPEAMREFHALDAKAAGRARDAISNVQDHGADWYGLPAETDQDGLAVTCAKLVRESTPDAFARLEKARAAMAGVTLPGARSIKPYWQGNRYAGTRLNVDRALQGMPDAWGRFERARSTGTRQAVIYLDAGGHAGISADDLAWAPVAGLVIADLLEGAGYRAEIWINFATCDRSTCQIRAQLKAADMPVDTVSLSRACHAAFLRAVLYPNAVIHGNGQIRAPGYGCPERTNPAAFGDENAIVIGRCFSLNAAVAEINRVIKLFSEV